MPADRLATSLPQLSLKPGDTIVVSSDSAVPIEQLVIHGYQTAPEGESVALPAALAYTPTV